MPEYHGLALQTCQNLTHFHTPADMLIACVHLPLSGVRVWVGAAKGTNADHLICSLQKHAPVAAAEPKEHLRSALSGE